MLKVFMRN